MVKCENLVNLDMSGPQPYFSSACLAKARMGFRIQTKMVVCPGNMKRMYKDRMMCEVCVAWRQEEEQVVATQEHIQVCPAYSRLRVGRDLEGSYSDLIDYCMDYMLVKLV